LLASDLWLGAGDPGDGVTDENLWDRCSVSSSITWKLPTLSTSENPLRNLGEGPH